VKKQREELVGAMMTDILREQYGIDLYKFGKHTKPLHECQAAVYELYDRYVLVLKKLK
jgi:hypothetical protein